MEDDLTWLARNVHEWPDTALVSVFDPQRFVLDPFEGELYFCHPQWLARRSELQNKPSWKDAPEWASYRAQSDSGTWHWFDGEPEINEMPDSGEFWNASGYSAMTDQCGEVLGNWRDTLERRPIDLSEPAVTERLAKATEDVMAAVPALMDEKFRFDPSVRPDLHVKFKLHVVPLDGQANDAEGFPSGSAEEDNRMARHLLVLMKNALWALDSNTLADLHQLCDAELTKRDAAVCGGHKYLDANWFERGELPPVGTECEAVAEGVKAEKCKIIAYHKQQVAVQWAHFNDGCLDVLSMPGWAFRPISPDRDALMDAIVSQGFLSKDGGVCGQIADAILADGFKRGGWE